MDAPVTARPSAHALVDAMASVWRGPREVLELVTCTWLAGGHLLIEDHPGVGKTTLARALALALGGVFRRLQCTPDLMPADITGISIWDDRERSFVFQAGPVFCDVLLADELNRTPPRTQAALLEALSEGQVTVDGESRRLAEGFICIATQNPVEQTGTYPLPESQRDRFLMALRLGYPERSQELDLLCSDGAEADLGRVAAVFSPAIAARLRAEVREIQVSDVVRGYLLDVIEATRRSPLVLLGASPRAALGLQRCAQARALLAGRSFAIPEDVQGLAVATLSHRVLVRPGQDPHQVVTGLCAGVPCPR